MSTLGRLTSFNGVALQLLSDEGRVPDWTRELVIHVEKIASSSKTIRQFDGFTDWTLETRIMVPDEARWRALEAMQGTRGDLLHAGLISAMETSTIHEFIDNQIYARWPGVLLEKLEEPRRVRDGRVLATATFSRRSEVA